MVIGVIAIIVLMATEVCAQQRTLLSRSALDSLVNPKLSAYAERLTPLEATIDLGEIEATDTKTIRFTLSNNSHEAITITEIRSTCSCLRVMTKPQQLAKGESLDVEATFNPSGGSNAFKHDILVYTTLDRRPTQRLAIVGSIKSSEQWGHLRQHMGELRLSRKEVTLDNIGVGKLRTEHIACANTSSHALRIVAHSTIEGLSLRCEPELLGAGSEGEITISYLSDKELTHDITTMLIIEGIAGSPTERMIKIRLQK